MSTEQLGTLIFCFALLHTFFASSFKKWGDRFQNESFLENSFHFLGEVEIIFLLWSFILFILLCLFPVFFTPLDPENFGLTKAIHYFETRNYTEALFVFVVMTLTATKPMLSFFEFLLERSSKLFSKIFSCSEIYCEIFCILFFGCLLGSLITEPAAMTLSALLLKKKLSQAQNLTPKNRFRFFYALFAVLLVNISLGGVLTHFAAPPVLMVSRVWNWSTPYLFFHFGWRAIGVLFLNSLFFIYIFRKSLQSLSTSPEIASKEIPLVISLIHLLFLALLIVSNHHPVIFSGIFLLFLGFYSVTPEFQSALKLKDSLLVATFLAGLILLGGFQSWWITPLFTQMKPATLFFTATGLTAFTDNAALTFLGSLLPHPTEAFQYALVSGAVTGGGLTLIANAPNPIASALLQPLFPEKVIKAFPLFIAAIPPTLMAIFWFWIL